MAIIHGWYALVSQTGKELYDVCSDLNIFPERIVSTKELDELYPKLNRAIHKAYETTGANTFFYIPLDLTKNVNALDSALMGADIVTLHGWLRILPEVTCNKYNIYNGHPGDIVLYPELKGFNPQKKAHSLELKTSGSVLHEVTPVVDGGEIFHRAIQYTQGKSLEEVYDLLRESSLLTWKLFIMDKVTNKLTSSKKYAISGAHSTGKTTLVNKLQETFSDKEYSFHVNMTRNAKMSGLKINESGTDETQISIINEHLRRLTVLGPSILDRCLLDGYVYTRALYEINPKNVDITIVEYAEDSLMKYIDRYEKIFFVRPEFDIVDDGTRSTDPVFYKKVCDLFEDSLDKIQPGKLVHLSGSVEERTKTILEHLCP